MKLLLDTHVFLWFIVGSNRLPSHWRASIESTSNDVYLSVISVWEAIIKHGIGKLALPKDPGEYLPAQRRRHQISDLELDEASVARLTKLPAIHRDPFDRMLACQALEHDLVLMTVDPVFRSYSVSILPTT